MKKIGIVLVLFLLTAGIVVAGSIEDLDYKDKVCPLGRICDTNRQVDDNDVTIDADTLNGETSDDLKDYADDQDVILGTTLTETLGNQIEESVTAVRSSISGGAKWVKIMKFLFKPTKSEGIWTDRDALSRYNEVSKEYGTYEDYIIHLIDERCGN